MTTTSGNGAKDKSTATEAKIVLSYEMEATVMPLLKKLKEANPLQFPHLINVLETNLQHLVKNYSCVSSLASAYQCLTPVETLVAAMVRQGLSTQIIAKTLNIASGTVSIHRKHIRKKLDLDHKAINLHSYLLSLTE
ncbi:conserved hypothetical protein [Crenothrix polyspora]|uniref:HTH luxR-type domain-containing protein n=1 Tax=Crenothrix polyspora TaxID=360316 RepID=A0A1R4HGU8_9GAMM|nr:helix-turn-helix transcriptional regulator [Crenothrix polyspora]SJM95453.1 conserved hypothetical protein [Crenothrix polyspora]